MSQIPNIVHYTTTQKYSFDDLKKRWEKYQESLHVTEVIKNDINHYIYFLHEVEHYRKVDIAKLLGLTRERIGQIIASVKSELKRKRGDTT